MENTALKNSMVEFYKAHSAAQDYILGFMYKGNIYMAQVGESEIAAYMKLERAGENRGYALKYKPNPAMKVALLPSATLICSNVFFEEQIAESKYNRGEAFEKLVTEYYGKKWYKDNVPFTQAGDIEINGIKYQIKYQKATFITERTIQNMRRG